jgi:hypothetical protein
MILKSAWKSAIMRFILDNLGRMGQDDVDAWLHDEIAFAELLEPALRNLTPYRDMVLRELYQISPSEIFDVWRLEHPEILFSDTDAAIVKIGQELLGIRSIVLSLETGNESESS